MSSTCLAAVLSFAIASAGPAAPDLGVWVEPTAKKVFQDSPPGAVREIDLAAARGEWESAQVVLRAAGPATVRVEVGELKGGEGGESLPAGAVQIRRVAYIPVPYAGKAWPDPLIPVDAGAPIALPANENVPLLVTVRVHRDARPGLYRGEVRISGGSALVVVPVALRVWPFEIPVRPSVQTAFGLSMEYAWKFEGVAPGTSEARAMHERYWRMLVDHRISPYEIPVDILDPDAGRFLDDPGLTSFLIPYREDSAWLKARIDRCREKGWLARAYVYPWDEPVTAEQYAKLKRGVERVRAAGSGLRIVSPFYRDAENGRSAYDALDGSVDIWCAVSAYFKPERMEEKRKAGGQVWWYVCCGPGSPYANLHLTMDGVDHRVLPWQMVRYRIEGFLYWSTTYWNPAFLKSPWTDMVTVPDINKQLSGDGSLLYPGRLPSGERVAEGPVASLRLVDLRDGFEDLEYLVLLEKAEGRPASDSMAVRITPDLQHFSKDPADYEKARREIASQLSGIGGE